MLQQQCTHVPKHISRNISGWKILAKCLHQKSANKSTGDEKRKECGTYSGEGGWRKSIKKFPHLIAAPIFYSQGTLFGKKEGSSIESMYFNLFLDLSNELDCYLLINWAFVSHCLPIHPNLFLIFLSVMPCHVAWYQIWLQY